MLIPYHQLPENAKIWIYQSSRNFNVEEVAELSIEIENFVEAWQSHQIPVYGFGSLYYRRFIVLFADEDKVNVSGCSIDSSVKFIKEMEQKYQVNFFDRMKICYKIQEQMVGSFSMLEIENYLAQEKIKKDTIVFNNLVQTKIEFEQKWEVSIENSLFSKYLLAKSN